MARDDLISGWSCDERNRKECRNPHGCHCREITALRLRVCDFESGRKENPRQIGAALFAAVVARDSR